MDRAEHLSWAKKRALEHVDRGDLAGAVSSMTSDLLKHDGFDSQTVASLGGIALMDIHSPEKIRRWVEGFN